MNLETTSTATIEGITLVILGVYLLLSYKFLTKKKS